MNKISLETCVLDKQNVLDYPIDKLIEDLEKKLKQNWKEHGEWIDLEATNPERYHLLAAGRLRPAQYRHSTFRYSN